MGCAALRIEDYDIAETSFARVTAIDPSNGEAWSLFVSDIR
jgi:Flp pilus assembly protein TadD